jgi:hypothetical protein
MLLKANTEVKNINLLHMERIFILEYLKFDTKFDLDFPDIWQE